MAYLDALGEYFSFPSIYQAGCWQADRGLSTGEQKKHCPEAAMKRHSPSNIVLPPWSLLASGHCHSPHLSHDTEQSVQSMFSLKPRPHQEVGKRIKIM